MWPIFMGQLTHFGKNESSLNKVWVTLTHLVKVMDTNKKTDSSQIALNEVKTFQTVKW
jgi:hypothetical protein